MLSGTFRDSRATEILKGFDKDNILIDMIAKTTFDELSALIRCSKIFLGMPAGNTIYSTVIKHPTIILWSNYFSKEFATNCIPPDSFGKWYHPIWAETFREDTTMELICRHLGENNG